MAPIWCRSISSAIFCAAWSSCGKPWRILVLSRTLSPALLCVLCCALAVGCGDRRSPAPASSSRPQALSAKQSDDTLRYALALLDSNDGVDAAEAAQRESDRRESIAPDEPARRLIYGQTPSSLADQLNRWVGAQMTPDDWKPDPMAADLPQSLRELPAVQNLGDKRFSNTDGAVLREQRWLHEIARWVCGDASDDLERGRRLFDWTIRNIQLDAAPGSDEEQARPPYLPWHLLALGHGQAQDRAWLFML